MESKQPMPASVVTSSPIANRCAAPTRSIWCCVMTFCIVWLNELITFAFQKYAVAV